MKKINAFIDKLVYAGDKQNPDTYRKGRFFIVSMSIFALVTILYLPYYLGESIETVPLVKPLYYVSLVALLLVFLVYPRYGYRILLFILFSLPSALTSFISVYYSTGGLFSSDLGMSVVMILFVFLVTNKLIGLISVALHVLIYLFFYYAEINGYRDFMADAMVLGADYYINITIVSFVFAGLMILLHENSKDKYLADLKSAKAEIEHQKAEIISSITYAKRIQQSKLPNESDFVKLFPDSFLLFKPKDIVSGDFYYFQEHEQTIFFAAADCTGHGVPGAIMSMICSEKLEEAIGISQNPSEILGYVNRRVKHSLKQTESDDSSRDGMDIALCVYDKMNKLLTYAGANRPIWIVRQGQNTIEEIKATKSAIGGLTSDTQFFENRSIELNPGDTIYIFTDGYADQFSGITGKKIMTKKFKNILLEIQSKPMNEQKTFLNNFVEGWRGDSEQVDDILIIGVRV